MLALIAGILLLVVPLRSGHISSRIDPAIQVEQPGLVILGDVRLNDTSGPGLAGVNIYRAYAGYAGSLVATTDVNGHYDTGYAYIPGDEMVTVWAEKAGYTLDPAQYYWRHYYSHEVRRLDFVAYPLVTTCPQPLPIPRKLLVDRGSWQTRELTYPLYIYLGGEGSVTASAVITITSEAGTITQTGTLSVSSSLAISVPLLWNTTHHAVVYGQFEHDAGCSYVTNTAYDIYGSPLTIIQQPFEYYLPIIIRR